MKRTQSSIKKVLLIGEVDFPELRASSVRVLGIAKVLLLNGYNPVIVGRGTLRSATRIVEGVKYEYLTDEQGEKSAIQYIKALEKHYNGGELVKVILYASSSAKFYNTVKNWCEKNEVELILDVSENYSYKQFKRGIFDHNYLIFKFNYYFRFSKTRKLIVCSSYAKKQLTNKHNLIYILNAVMDVKPKTQFSNDLDKIRIVYAGEIGRKDRIDLLIKAILQLPYEERIRYEVYLIGPSKKEVSNAIADFCDNLEEHAWIVVTGKLTRKEVLQHLERSHFTFLLRPNETYANCGFPSKVAESMCMGVPVILNNTSDVCNYVINNQTGYVLDKMDCKSLQQQLKNILNLSKEEYEDMVIKCIEISKKFGTQYLASDEEFRRFLNE